MAGSSQSTVESLLSSLTSVLLDEAQLLRGIRGDVQFIKDEMESMNGFLLDVADGGHLNYHQVRAWRRQVREVAYDSQNYIDRYMQTFGASRPSAGLLGSLQRVPHFVWTMPDRHRIAVQIRDLKSRAREVGERRQRYGIKAHALSQSIAGEARTGDGSKLQEAEDARRRRVLADVTNLLNTDAQEVMDWLVRRGSHGHSPPLHASVSKFVKNMYKATSITEELGPELVKMVREMLGDEHPENIGDAAAILIKQAIDINKGGMLMAATWLKKKLGFGHDHPGTSAAGSQQDKKEERKPEADAMKRMMKAADPKELVEAEVLYNMQLTKWLARVLFHHGLLGELVLPSSDKRRWPRLLAIVTPPVDVHNPEADEPHGHKPATELAKMVYDNAGEAKHFDCMVWIDAGLHSQRKKRLQVILQQVLPPSSRDQDPDGQMSTLTEESLEREIQKHLKGKKFLIVLADHEDNTPWEDIIHAVPCDYSDDSVIIVTPLIQQTVQLDGWYTASWFFLYRSSRCKVHFYSHVEAASRKANELLVGSDHGRDLQDIIKKILVKCRWDSFSTKLVLHALYANPHRSKEELEALLLSLKDFSTVSNARKIIRFCYDDLPSQYKTCLLYLSIFPQNSKIRKTSLVRRWDAENLVTRRHALDEAERSFCALVDRGLILPDQIGPAGRVKSCMVHPHVFSFITNMAREEKVRDSDLQPELAHRLSIRNGIQQAQLSNKKQPTTHSSNTCWSILKCTASTDSKDYEYSLVDMITFLNLLPASSQLGLIKVLDLDDCSLLNKHNLRNICNKIFQLKYLSLRNTNVTELPKEIGKLQDLETFDIRQTKIKSFPRKASVLQKLVNLLAGHNEPPSSDDTGSDESFSSVHMPRRIGSMTNIQVLSHVEISQTDDEKELGDVGQLLQLRKLGVVIPCNNKKILTLLLQQIGKLDECLCSLTVHIEPVEGPEADVDMNTEGAEISPPRSLENLNINGKIRGLPTWIKELHQLSRVTLCRTSLKDIDIEVLGKLVSLCCIVLRHKSYEQKKLTLKEKEFKKLQFLVIECSDISSIHFEHNGAPNLEKIVWISSNMENLYGIEQLLSLKEIELSSNSDLSRLIQAIETNPNRPILTHKPISKAAAVDNASNIPGQQ
uniref:Uncharacterized protein n=1 Tax=Avena sativa TaxID=4498 RepID=A0ACD5W0X0_AVESA